MNKRIRLVSKHTKMYVNHRQNKKTCTLQRSVAKLLQCYVFVRWNCLGYCDNISCNALRSGHVSNQRTSRCILLISPPTYHRQITDLSLPITYFSVILPQGPFVLNYKAGSKHIPKASEYGHKPTDNLFFSFWNIQQ